MNRRGSFWVVMLFAAVALLAGCHGDPNVRKQKYLESGKRYSAEGKYREAAIQYLECPEGRQELCRRSLCAGAGVRASGSIWRGVWRTRAYRGLAAHKLQGADRPWQPVARGRQDRRRASAGQCRDGGTTEQSRRSRDALRHRGQAGPEGSGSDRDSAALWNSIRTGRHSTRIWHSFKRAIQPRLLPSKMS